MQYNVLNLINYLENKIDDIELNDIYLALYYLEYIGNNMDPLANRLRSDINNLMQIRANEVRNFINILNNKNLTYYQEKLWAYYYLPFKNSKDIDIEKYLFSELFRDKRIENGYEYLLVDFTGLINMAYQEIFDLIATFTFYEGITYDTVINSSLTHPLNIYNDDNYIMNNYQNDVGKYAELVVYNEERRLINPRLSNDIIWVSRYVGDGFGFDILSYNDKNMEKPIEVKGSLNEEKLFKPELTDNEYNFFLREENSLIYQVYVQNIENIFINIFRKENDMILDSSNTAYKVEVSNRKNYKGKNNKIFIKK